ncbi:MAG: rod shape-determining protein MreD [Sphingopyxis sp.]|nr:rod shape-determining protein MreD [Sphingopyxis sp.]
MSSLAPTRIGDPPSQLRLQAVPILTVMFASALPMMLPLVAASTWLPPLGLLLFLAWRLLHPSLWPVWIGLPLGLWDDLLSGQPVGSAMGLWTLTLLVIDFVDQRTYWRGYWQDWLIAGIAVAAIIFGGAGFAHPVASLAELGRLVDLQIIVSILLFPMMVRVAAWLDSIRLLRR